MKIVKWRGSKDPQVLVLAEILSELQRMRMFFEHEVDRVIVALASGS